MLQRGLYLLKIYVLTVIWFIVAKIGFVLYNVGDSGSPAGGAADGMAPGGLTLGDMLDVIAHGLSLDLSMALYLLAVPFLCCVASIWMGAHRLLRLVLRAYYGLLSVVLALAFVADTSLYEFWHYKLDATCLQYLATPTDAMASVSVGYIVVRMVVCIVMAFVFYQSYTRPQWRIVRSRRPLVEAVAALAMVPCIVIGIRGGIDESTTNVGQVYYSQNQFLNHAAVNPVFSFLASFENTASEVAVYNFYGDVELGQLTEGLYFTGGIAGDTLLTTQRPNVVVVLLESCGSMFLHVMPNLRRAAAEGIDFTNCYGNSYRTDRGTVCALSGYLSFPTMSVMKMSSKVAHLSSIARSLRREGYSTEYLYGGDINFTKMKGYLISTGFEQLRWKADYSQEEQNTSKWGVRDDITFKSLSDMVCRHRDGKPFLIGYSTLSSHEPWDVPVDKYKEKQYNGFYYVDQCIGRFLDDMKRSGQWDNLLIVFMPDHSSDFHEYTEQHPDRNRIPMVWTGGAVRQPRRLDVLCNQSDFAATLLGQMGIAHDDFRFSRDVISKDYRHPFAIHMFNNGISMIDSTGFMLYDLIADRITVTTSPDADRMARTAKAVLQLASEDLSSK